MPRIECDDLVEKPGRKEENPRKNHSSTLIDEVSVTTPTTEDHKPKKASTVHQGSAQQLSTLSKSELEKAKMLAYDDPLIGLHHGKTKLDKPEKTAELQQGSTQRQTRLSTSKLDRDKMIAYDDPLLERSKLERAKELSYDDPLARLQNESASKLHQGSAQQLSKLSKGELERAKMLVYHDPLADLQQNKTKLDEPKKYGKLNEGSTRRQTKLPASTLDREKMIAYDDPLKQIKLKRAKELAYDDPLAGLPRTESESIPAPQQDDEAYETAAVRPGAVHVSGIGNSGTDVSATFDTVSENIQESNQDRMMEIANADLVDPEVEEARIMARIVNRAVKATVLEETPLSPSPPTFCNRRNIIAVLVAAVFLIAVIVTIVIVFAISNSDDIPADETLSAAERTLNFLSQISLRGDILQDGSPQNLAYSLLLEENNYVGGGMEESILTERYIALVFYFSTNGKHWFNDLGFLQNSSVCEWTKGDTDGISCNERNEITSIHAEGNNLTGPIPSEIFNLPSLERLRLKNNQLQGSVPSNGVAFEFGNLALLDLTMNGLTGAIPDSLISSRTIRELYLGKNKFNGTIPNFQEFNGLYKLYLNDNSLTGNIPESISMLSLLTIFNISQNILDGTIPQGIGQMTSLERINTKGNALSGSIPYQVENLEDLKAIELDHNKLNGTIPEELGNINGLATIYLNNNQLSGTIPSELASLESLIDLDLNSNKLTGTLPTEFAIMRNILVLQIEENDIVDSLEEMFCLRNDTYLPRIGADCRGDNPEVECTCCHTCCDHTGKCIEGASSMCGFKILVEIWFKNMLSRNAICDCTEGGKALLCKFAAGEICESCNIGESVCATVDFTKIEVDQLFRSYATLGFTYTKELNHSVVIWASNTLSWCTVSIDGVPCESCEIIGCGPSGERAPKISCENIHGIDDKFDGCAVTQASNVGVYSILQWMIVGNLYSKDSCETPNIFDRFSLT